MHTGNRSSNDTQSILGWMASERLYEEFLFFYVLIIAFWILVGLLGLGFVVDGYSLQRNLFFNFICFLLLAGCIAATPFWYRLIFGRGARLQRRSQEIAEQVAAIEDPVKRQAIQQHLANNGELPPRTAQKWALLFLGWCVLFEIFFISAWVKDLALVWQPAWVDAIIGWVRGHTNLPPLNENRDIFVLWIDGSGKEFLKARFDSEQAFLDSAFGQSAMLFHFWHAISFFPILGSLIVLFWQLLGWAGLSRLNPETIGGIKGFLWRSFISFFMLLMVVAGFSIYFRDVGYRAGMLMGKAGWLNGMWIYFGLFFVIIGLQLIVGWLFFWKNFLLHIYRKVMKRRSDSAASKRGENRSKF